MDDKFFDEIMDEVIKTQIGKNISLKYVSHGILIVEDDHGEVNGLHQIHVERDLLPTFINFEEPKTSAQKQALDKIISQIYGKMCFLDLQIDLRKLKADVKAEVKKLIKSYR